MGSVRSLVLSLPLVAVLGCSSTSKAPGELVLSLQTDMTLPKDIDEIYVEVTAHGTTSLANQYPVGPGAQQIPATIGILAGPDPTEPVHIRVLARQLGNLRVLREAVTTVPVGRTATLRMPIQWLCDGQVVEDAQKTNAGATSSCPPGKTCIAGSCTDPMVTAAKLPDYDPKEIFGGATAAGAGGNCLDTVGCFAQGLTAGVNLANCSIAKPPPGAGINVALVQGPNGTGICGPDACLLPLDANTEDGTGWTDTGTGAILLPPAVCDRLTSGAITSVAVTAACPTKTQAIPACGPWSSAQGTMSTFDAGAPSDAELPPPATIAPDGAPSGTVSGNVSTIPFAAKDAIAAVGSGIAPSFGGSPGAAPRQLMLVGFADSTGMCPFLQATQAPSGSYLRRGTSELGVIIVGADNTTPIGPGDYPLLGPALPQPSGAFAIVDFLHADPQCIFTPTTGWELAQSGLVQIDSVSPASVAGTFSATFLSGSVGGSFDAASCSLDLSQLFGNTQDGGGGMSMPEAGPGLCAAPKGSNSYVDGGPYPYDVSLGYPDGPMGPPTFDSSVGPPSDSSAGGDCIPGTWVFPAGATGTDGPTGVTLMGSGTSYFLTFNFGPNVPGTPKFQNIPTQYSSNGSNTTLGFSVDTSQAGGPDGGGNSCMPPNILTGTISFQNPPNGPCPPNAYFSGSISNCLSCGGGDSGAGNCQGCGGVACPIGFPVIRSDVGPPPYDGGGPPSPDGGPSGCTPMCGGSGTTSCGCIETCNGHMYVVSCMGGSCSCMTDGTPTGSVISNNCSPPPLPNACGYP